MGTGKGGTGRTISGWRPPTTPSCSGWRGLSAGWMRPTPAEAAAGTRSGQPACGACPGGPQAQDGNTAMTAVLELREVSKVYGTGAAEVHALRRVSLSVGGGELVAVMGPSGSGKSTLLTISGSLEEPTSGQVLVAGIDLSGASLNDQAKLRRRLIGDGFQDFNLLAGLTAAENVTLPLELDGVGVKAARPAAMKALEELGVAERAYRFSH